MVKIFAIVFTQLAIIASILGLYFTLLPSDFEPPIWHWLLIILAIVAGLFLAGHEIYQYLRYAPKTYRSKEKITSYMQEWVSSGGRVVIFSRDMSWAQNEAIDQLLSEKARHHELTICLERNIPFTNKLRQLGATVVTYEALGHVPRSRFTIIDYERDGARVAVGVKFGDDHTIQVFRSGSHAFFAVAEDLVKFLLGYDENVNVP